MAYRKEVKSVSEDKKNKKRKIVFTNDLLAKMIIADLSLRPDGYRLLKQYKQQDIREMIENYKNKKNQDELVKISRILYVKSMQYKRLINLFSQMPLFAYTLTPAKNLQNYSQNKVLKQYTDIGEMIKQMNMKHEMWKVLNVAYLEDVFYGYIHRNKNSFFIQQFPSSICKITSIEDGVFNYSINMAFFQRNEKLLEVWPEEVQEKYRQWKALKKQNANTPDWVELDPKNTICIKINEDMIETLPPFAGVFDSIFDIHMFKEMRKDREAIQNYMLLVQQIPINEDSGEVDDFLINEDTFKDFHNQLASTVPDQVGVVTTPMPIETVQFNKDKVDRDNVALAERDFWDSSGVPKSLFNTDKQTAQGLLKAIVTNEEMIFTALAQIERWLNRFLKLLYGSNLLFNVKILPITRYNQKEMFDMYIQSAQYGFPVKGHLGAILGFSPLEIINLTYLENDILKLHEKFIPLMSSHTMSTKNGEIGRPEKDEDEVAEETARTDDKPNTVLDE